VAHDPPPGPPAFLRLAAHPLRWRLLSALAGGDRRVRELVTLVGEPQNLVSYHLRLLREAGLVAARRSSSDGRDTYYHLDLDRCADALAGTGAALHPALHPALGEATALGPESHVAAAKVSVLFVCTGNSARSPMAEALLRHHAPRGPVAVSAGTRPRAHLHPAAVRVLAAGYGVDVRDVRPRSLDELGPRRFDHVVTLCDRAREQLPELPHAPHRIHWSIPDPSTAADADRPGDPAFRRTAADIETRIRHLLPVLATTHH
jgi:ArsR family transcriptional regulator, arsenate/arsenite/antimonite-responsive transcriptional repressor / arsenate reductase (thioredoxin)